MPWALTGGSGAQVRPDFSGRGRISGPGKLGRIAKFSPRMLEDSPAPATPWAAPDVEKRLEIQRHSRAPRRGAGRSAFRSRLQVQRKVRGRQRRAVCLRQRGELGRGAAAAREALFWDFSTPDEPTLLSLWPPDSGGAQGESSRHPHDERAGGRGRRGRGHQSARRVGLQSAVARPGCFHSRSIPPRSESSKSRGARRIVQRPSMPAPAGESWVSERQIRGVRDPGQRNQLRSASHFPGGDRHAAGDSSDALASRIRGLPAAGARARTPHVNVLDGALKLTGRRGVSERRVASGGTRGCSSWRASSSTWRAASSRLGSSGTVPSAPHYKEDCSRAA